MAWRQGLASPSSLGWCREEAPGRAPCLSLPPLAPADLPEEEHGAERKQQTGSSGSTQQSSRARLTGLCCSVPSFLLLHMCTDIMGDTGGGQRPKDPEELGLEKLRSRAGREEAKEGGKQKKHWEPCVYRISPLWEHVSTEWLLPLPSCSAPSLAACWWGRYLRGKHAFAQRVASNRRRQCKKKNSQTNRAKKHMKPWGRGGECTFHHSERFCALRWCCSWLGQCATVPRPHLGCRCLHHLHHLFHSPAVLHGSVSEAPLCYAGSWWSHIAQTLNTSYDYTFTARKKKKKRKQIRKHCNSPAESCAVFPPHSSEDPLLQSSWSWDIWN